MAYIAELQIKVDSSQVESATQKLKEFTQATSGSAQAESASRKVKQDSANKTAAAEAKAQRAEETRYDQWFAMSARRDKEEAANASRRQAIVQKDQRDSATTAARQQKVAAAEAASEQKRLDSWLKMADRRAADEAKQLSAVKSSQSSQSQVTAQRVAAAKTEAKAQKDASDETQRIDKIRYQSTLRRFAEEEKLASQSQKSAAKAVSSIGSEAKALNNLLGSIDPVTRSLQRLDAQEKALQANKPNLTTEQYTRYQGIIDRARQSTEKYNSALNKTGITAKQVRQAQQGLPAQFTDIIVSLQGGQAPLTVLLQQGGQIKDMFGGIGPGIKGVAGAIMGLINPVTVFAGALAALAVAYNLGAKEGDAYRLSLVSTGNAAGTTVAAMADMAKEVDGIAGTSSKAAEVLAQLAASGQVTADSFVGLTTAAVKWEKASGTAAAETVKQFAALGGDPLDAAKKLNEQTNFLTASIYQQATALVKQGREAEAATLLQNEYADTLTTRADEIISKQGSVEKAWNGITGAAKEAWDAMLDIGRPKTLEDDLDQIIKNVNKRAAGLNLFGGGFAAQEPGGKSTNDAWKDRLQQEVDDQKAAREAMFRGEAVKQGTKDFEDFQKSLVETADKADKLATALKTIDREVASARKAGYTITDADVEKAKAQARETFKDKGGPKSATIDDTDVNDLQNKVSEIKAQYATLTEAVKAQQEAGTLSAESGFTKRQQLLSEESAKTQIAYQDQIAALEALKGSKNISANQTISLDRKIADARSKMVVAEATAQKDLNKSAAEEEKRLKRQTQNVKAYNESLEQMVNNLRTAGQRDRAGLAMSSGQRGVSDQMNSEDDRYADEVRSLNNQRAENPELAGEVAQKLTAAATAHTKMKDQIVQNYEDMRTAQRDWGAGISGAFKQYIEDGQNYANLTNEAFTSAFSSMEDAIVGFVTTGKLSFADLTKSILSDMARMAVKAAASSALSAMFGMFGGAAAPSGSNAQGYDNLAGWTLKQAKGGAWDGGKQFFAKGGAFTNSVVSKPTDFNLGQMGEKGPEAIMPLTRAADGSLGVRAQVDLGGLQQASAGTGGGVLVQVNIDGKGNNSSTASDPGYNSFGKDIGQFVDQRYKQLMSKDLQPGGDIWKSQQG